jgi:hypothetical protein
VDEGGEGRRSVNASPTPSVKSIVSTNRFEHLHVDQVNAVEQAEKRLTAAELKLFHARMKVSKVYDDDTSEGLDRYNGRDCEPGPSKDKGIDPRNFGNLECRDQKWNNVRRWPCGMRSSECETVSSHRSKENVLRGPRHPLLRVS